ncbi:MAG: transcriptional regulator [Bacteroidetes bacterium GWF2_38_335]|nr:MAG: transcriptional regulator [Bacteroidetes bacterium GWF2_38_335]OFY80006.1 MAG: transcriptional regulator [Bacteroidetes bacterium RIFOXYA12_FULL_38_20]
MENKNKIKIFSFDELKDKHLGKVGTLKRDKFENELRIDLIGEMIKQTRMERHLTQSELGDLIGVQKSQISRIENNAKNVTIVTILKVFNALKAKINFDVELLDGEFKIA